MNLEIKSKILGETLSFHMPSDGGYIYLESKGKPGTLGDQICYGGWTNSGSTIRSTPEGFKSACRRWYQSHIRAMRKEGLC